jgi:hypothetical protein
VRPRSPVSQVAAGEWTVTVRVDGHGSLGVWRGLAGSTRVDDLLARASAARALGVPAGSAAPSARRGSRLLRAVETLEGAGVPRVGGEVHLCAGEAGGMRWSWLGLGPRQRAHVHPATTGATLTAYGGTGLIQIQSELGFQLGSPGGWPAHVRAAREEPRTNTPGIFAPADPSMDSKVGAGNGEELAGALGTLLQKLSRDVSGIEGAAQRLDAVTSGLEKAQGEALATSTIQAAAEESNNTQVMRA